MAIKYGRKKMKDKETRIEFKVIDNNTGKEADISKIALKEDWAKDLMYCDMQGFAILDDGNLILLDECGKFEYCPSERFSIQFENSVVLSKEEYERITKELVTEQRATEIAKEYFEKIRKETAEKIYLQAKAIVNLTKYIVQGGEYIHIDALKEIIKNCGIEIKE